MHASVSYSISILYRPNVNDPFFHCACARSHGLAITLRGGELSPRLPPLPPYHPTVDRDEKVAMHMDMNTQKTNTTQMAQAAKSCTAKVSLSFSGPATASQSSGTKNSRIHIGTHIMCVCICSKESVASCKHKLKPNMHVHTSMYDMRSSSIAWRTVKEYQRNSAAVRDDGRIACLFCVCVSVIAYALQFA